MNVTLHERNEQLGQLQQQLPGSIPYDNLRPINVPARCEGMSLQECLKEVFPQVSQAQWNSWFSDGHILHRDARADRNAPVKGGQQFWHLFPNTIEPEVNACVKIMHENACFVVVQKPAPLPVHPSGRFNRNTLISLLATVYRDEELRLVHRLDANTTGVMVLARSREAATSLRRQFESEDVHKQYLVCCLGAPQRDDFVCDQRIAKETVAGGARELRSDGQESRTRFRVMERFSDGKTLLQAFPETGRTNQIRIHLWGLGLPVLGDPTYREGGQRVSNQTLDLSDPPMCLHAQRLSFKHPETGKNVQFHADDPAWVAERKNLSLTRSASISAKID